VPLVVGTSQALPGLRRNLLDRDQDQKATPRTLVRTAHISRSVTGARVRIANAAGVTVGNGGGHSWGAFLAAFLAQFFRAFFGWLCGAVYCA
jgi:hypothetical protein